MCDLIIWPWPRKLLGLPFWLRLSICMLCFPLCIAMYLLTFPLVYSGFIVTIPMALASWIFNKRGACTCYGSYIVIQVVYNVVIFRGLRFWPAPNIIFFVSALVVLFIEGSAVVSLRHLLLEEEETRVKAEKGEDQMRLAYEQQRQLNQIKTQFMLNVNHELRTPLASIYGCLELLQLLSGQDEHLDRGMYREHLETALHSCEELRSIVNNVLKTIEIGSDCTPLRLEELSVAGAVHQVLEGFDTFKRYRHRIHLAIPDDIRVWANVQCIRHVIYNLLSNAFKYSPEDTPVMISAALSGDVPQQVCICVQDAGPGIPPDEMPRLFGQFVRLQRDLAGTVHGSGLGLYISKHLVEAMGGRIWVESAGVPRQGSHFYFTLPSASPYMMVLTPPLASMHAVKHE